VRWLIRTIDVGGEFIQALTTDHTALQSARSATISETSSRSAVYSTALSSAVVVPALVPMRVRAGTGAGPHP